MKKIFLVLIVTLLALSGCAGDNSNDIINPEAQFLYFYGATCPHCQKLNAEVKKEDLFSKVAVEKREIYYNNENRELFLALTEKLGIPSSEAGVPFVYNKTSGKYSIGVEPALVMFRSGINKNTEQEDESIFTNELPEVDASELPIESQ